MWGAMWVAVGLRMARRGLQIEHHRSACQQTLVPWPAVVLEATNMVSGFGSPDESTKNTGMRADTAE